MELAGKSTIVTGTASGIGAAIVRAFLEAGAGGSARSTATTEAPAELAARFPGKLQHVVGDVAKEAPAAAAAQSALAAYGRIDVLVNNAAIAPVQAIHLLSEEAWDRTMAVNCKSMYWMARHVVPVMQRQRDGAILNTGSISSMVGIPGQGVYGPSKGAVVQITRQMAVEYAKDGIRVNAVCPGTVDTPLLRKAMADSEDGEAFLNGLKDGHPIGRVAAAEEIADFFVYLASDRARFITGSILMIDGGFTAR